MTTSCSLLPACLQQLGKSRSCGSSENWDSRRERELKAFRLIVRLEKRIHSVRAVIPELGTHCTTVVSQGYLQEGDKYAIYVCSARACVCVSQLAADCANAFERGTVAHCCVPIAYYRMARTIRFHLRPPRYFHRASPISPRSIRRSIGRKTMGKVHTLVTIVPDATMNTGKFEYVGLLYVLRGLTRIGCSYANSAFSNSALSFQFATRNRQTDKYSRKLLS